MGEHVGKSAYIERMVGVMVVAFVVTSMLEMLVAAMAVNLCLKNESCFVHTIMMMVRHDGVQQDDCTCQCD